MKAVEKPGESRTDRAVESLSIIRSLQPVLNCLKLFGIYIRDESLTPLQKIHGYLVFTIVNIHFAVLFYHTCQQIYRGAEVNRSFLVHVISNAIIQLTVYNVLFFRQRSVARLLIILKDIQRTSAHHSKRTYTVAKYYVLLEVLVVVCRKVMNMIEYVTEIVLLDTYPFIFKDSGYGLLEAVLLCFWNVGGLFFFAFFTLYIANCIVLNSSLSNISRKRMTSKDWMLQSTSPVGYHNTICDGANETNSVFSELLFVSSACQLAAILYYLREMNLHLPTVNVQIENVTFLVETLIRFAASNVYAGKVNSRILTSLTEFNEDDNFIKGELYNNKSSIMTKVLMYKRRIILQPPGLSGWSLYAPSKTTVVLAASNILTYVLVLYRLTKPPDEDNLLFSNMTNATNETNTTQDPFTLTPLM